MRPRSSISSLHEEDPLQNHSSDNAASNDAAPSGYLDNEQRIKELQKRWNSKMGRLNWKERELLFKKERQDIREKNAQVDQGLARQLTRHSLAIYLILAFAFLAVFAWTVTCVLVYRPIGAHSYYDHSGYITNAQWQSSDRWRKAANIASTIVGSISIPVTSAICAKAAAVYCQRKSDKSKPSLTLRQTLALADKGWSDLAVLRDVVRPKTSHQIRSPLLLLSALLVGLALIIPALQSAYINTIHIKVMSFDTYQTPLGMQNTPGGLSLLDSKQVIDSVSSSIVAGKLSDKQPYLWSSRLQNLNMTDIRSGLGNNITNFGFLPAMLYTATFPVGTDTGVARELALRLNSSVSCNSVPRSGFPVTCSGPNPLSQKYTNIIDDSDTNPFPPSQTSGSEKKFRIRICAPGDVTRSPWHASSNRQDIFEEFWLDMQSNGLDFTQYCYGNSTLGYFQLPNYWNKHTASGLLDTVPAAKRNTAASSNTNSNDLESDLAAPSSEFHGAPGPLLTSILATFGNDTFFDTVASYSNYSSRDDILCQKLRRPFTNLYGDSQGDLTTWWSQSSPYLPCKVNPGGTENSTFLDALFDWMSNFGNPLKATAALTLANYQSTNAILNLAVDPGTLPPVYDPGIDLQKFAISFPAMIVITVLLAVQLIGLALLAQYASRHQTWTESLDSFALLRLGASISEDVPILSALKAKEVGMLDRAGWVGAVGPEKNHIKRLALGGPDQVKTGQLYRLAPDGEEKVV